MEKIELSKLERLTLANQFRILAALGEGDVATHNANAEILLGGHTVYYSSVFKELGAEVPDKVTTELWDILDMFYATSQVLRDHPNETAGFDRKKLTFQGFDAEHEAYAEQARFLVEHMNRFEELKGGRFTSTSQDDMRRYRRMLPIFKMAFSSPAGVTPETLRTMQEAG